MILYCLVCSSPMKEGHGQLPLDDAPASYYFCQGSEYVGWDDNIKLGVVKQHLFLVHKLVQEGWLYTGRSVSQ